MFADAERFLDLPQAMIVLQHLGTVHVEQIGDHPMQSIPLASLLEFVLIQLETGVTFKTNELPVTVVVQNRSGMVTALQLAHHQPD